ncbi:MAG: hypothetical protein Q9187_001575 [Circinaria calcarea]
MSFTGGLQLSIELSKVFPVRKGVESVATQILNYVRNSRKSGSDVMVEEDLADNFGRGKITPDIEDKFKAAVKISKVNELHQGCEIRLECSSVPAITTKITCLKSSNSVRDAATILGWMHDDGDGDEEPCTERVLIFLTRGDAKI